MPIPLEKIVGTSSFFNDNLYHDLVMGCGLTGFLHMVNQTCIKWFCKRQVTVATATYLSEFMATQSMTDQTYMCAILHIIGVLLDYHSYAFGDNCAIIQQSNIPESKLMKHWDALAFHCVQEAVTLGFLQ